MVFLLDAWEFREAVGACLQISKLGIVPELQSRQQIMVKQQPLEAGEQVERKGCDAVIGEVYFLSINKIHIAEAAQLVLRHAQLLERLQPQLRQSSELVVLEVEELQLPQLRYTHGQTGEGVVVGLQLLQERESLQARQGLQLIVRALQDLQRAGSEVREFLQHVVADLKVDERG